VFAYLRPRALGPWSAMADVPARVRSLLARGEWSLDAHHAFSDQPWLCAQLDEGERAAAIRALRTRYGLDVSVRVPAQGDLAPLVRYWSVGHDPEAVRAVLAGARGGLAPVAALLPPMARARLNRFPAQGALEYDCFWTAARFFEGATPSDHFPGPQGIVDLVRDHYAPVPSADARLGDLVAFVDPNGTFSHTASQVAGDIVFTKNGRSRQRPWVLMHLDEVRAMYPLVREVRWYRRRASAVAPPQGQARRELTHASKRPVPAASTTPLEMGGMRWTPVARMRTERIERAGSPGRRSRAPATPRSPVVGATLQTPHIAKAGGEAEVAGAAAGAAGAVALGAVGVEVRADALLRGGRPVGVTRRGSRRGHPERRGEHPQVVEGGELVGGAPVAAGSASRR
jgi:hypothetical protein